MTLARVRALSVLGVLVLVALISVVWAIVSDDQTGQARSACGTIDPAKDIDIPEAKSVRLRVYNATDRAGLANEVALALKKRGFTIVTTGNDPEGQVVTGVAQIRYGPKGAGGAQLLRANVKQSEPTLDEQRTDPTIDLVIGAEYDATRDLTPPAQVKTTLDGLSPPPVPEVTC